MGSKLLATINAPAFTGNITIVLTDGFTTVNNVIAIDRRATTITALARQTFDLVSATGSNDSFVPIEFLVQTMVSTVGSNDSFTLLSMSVLLSTTGSDDGFTLGASVLVDNVTADGVAFNYRFKDFGSQTVATFAEAYIVYLYRPYMDSAQTGEDQIGCYSSGAEVFRANLLAAVRTKFNTATMQEANCDTTGPGGGPYTITYGYFKQ